MMMQRSARVAIHVGGRHAQNGQGLALRREGKSIKSEAKLLERGPRRDARKRCRAVISGR
jgi:hypothetical protein